MNKVFQSDRSKAIILIGATLGLLLTLFLVLINLPILQSVLGSDENQGPQTIENRREGQESTSVKATEDDEEITLQADFEVPVPAEYKGRDFDPFQYAQENGSLQSISPRSTAAIVRDVHHMTHGAIVAKEKWGYLTLNDVNIFTLLTELAAVENLSFVEKQMVEMLSNWYHGDVGSIDEDHNFLWDWEDGTIGKATGMDWDGVEEDILQRAIKNGYKP